MKSKTPNLGQIYLTGLSQKNSENQETKFDLYVQSRRVRQITLALDAFIQNVSKTQPTWLIDNQDLVDGFLEELMNDSMLVLDGIELDAEGMELSVSLMSDIHRALSTVEQVIGGGRGEIN